MDCPVFGAVGVLADQFAFGPLAGRVLGQAVHTRDAEEPRFYVLRVLTDRFAAAEGITVTKAEIHAFLASTAAALARDRAEAVERRDTLKREQAAGKLPAERKTLCRLPVAGRGRTDHEGGLQESARCGLFQPAAAGFGGDGDVCRTVRPALHEPF